MWAQQIEAQCESLQQKANNSKEEAGDPEKTQRQQEATTADRMNKQRQARDTKEKHRQEPEETDRQPEANKRHKRGTQRRRQIDNRRRPQQTE